MRSPQFAMVYSIYSFWTMHDLIGSQPHCKLRNLYFLFSYVVSGCYEDYNELRDLVPNSFWHSPVAPRLLFFTWPWVFGLSKVLERGQQDLDNSKPIVPPVIISIMHMCAYAHIYTHTHLKPVVKTVFPSLLQRKGFSEAVTLPFMIRAPEFCLWLSKLK